MGKYEAHLYKTREDGSSNANMYPEDGFTEECHKLGLDIDAKKNNVTNGMKENNNNIQQSLDGTSQFIDETKITSTDKMSDEDLRRDIAKLDILIEKTQRHSPRDAEEYKKIREDLLSTLRNRGTGI